MSSTSKLKEAARTVNAILWSSDYDEKLTELYNKLPFTDTEEDAILAVAYLRYGCMRANDAWGSCRDRVKAILSKDTRILQGIENGIPSRGPFQDQLDNLLEYYPKAES